MSPRHPPSDRNPLRADIMVGAVILAFTALPTQLRLPSANALLDASRIQLYPVDVAANLLGYLPLGLALARRGTTCALLVASVLALFAETMQLVSVGRNPSIVDVIMNVAGAGLGLALASRWPRLPDRVAVSRRAAMLAATMAVAYIAVGASVTVDALLDTLANWLDAPPRMTTNPRGASSDGILEGHWSFDRLDHDVAADDSGHGLNGLIANGPGLTSGRHGSAVYLDGQQWVDLGNPVALRLSGSMTLSAWVRPAAFPADDAAIISSLTDRELGYQLDLTVDQGPRTIGFKIADVSGHLMARYGRTPVVADHWYHVAGVYDASHRTLDVYLDGRLDNGCLMGTATARQQASGRHVFVGRRAGSRGFEFIGSIDEAEIQSRPQPPTEVAAEAGAVSRLSGPAVRDDASIERRGASDDAQCVHQKEPRPPRIAGMLVSLGMLIALACTGLWHGARFNLVVLSLCFSAGLLATFWPSFDAAIHNAWLAVMYLPLGGAAIIVAARK